MRSILRTTALILSACAFSSCGIPTALVRTVNNSLTEISELSDGTSSAYQSIR